LGQFRRGGLGRIYFHHGHFDGLATLGLTMTDISQDDKISAAMLMSSDMNQQSALLLDEGSVAFACEGRLGPAALANELAAAHRHLALLYLRIAKALKPDLLPGNGASMSAVN
jgi:hypothetical protein